VHRGEVAIDLLRKESFDLLIVDYKMPHMNGFEVFEQARELRPDMAFMLLTGHGTSDVMDDASAMGFHSIRLKPFTREQLRKAVERAMAGRSWGPSAGCGGLGRPWGEARPGAFSARGRPGTASSTTTSSIAPRPTSRWAVKCWRACRPARQPPRHDAT